VYHYVDFPFILDPSMITRITLQRKMLFSPKLLIELIRIVGKVREGILVIEFSDIKFILLERTSWEAGNAFRVTTHMSLLEVSCTMLNLRCQHVSYYLAHAGSFTCTMSCEVASLPQLFIR